METWKEFEANEVTHSVAHHLQAIFELGQDYGGWARVSDIARQLGITRGSVSINLRNIKVRGLVAEDEHHQVKLSPKGLKIVQGIKAKKAAMKAFLHDVLNLSDEQADIDSCKIEHLISDNMAERFVQFLRFLETKDPGVRPLLERFKDFKAQCPGDKTCSICKGHCLLDDLTHAS
jgi:DtxR family transcriptional regulator, Mn-dependent transcriptional regulator